jgi:hypothetical protein
MKGNVWFNLSIYIEILSGSIMESFRVIRNFIHPSMQKWTRTADYIFWSMARAGLQKIRTRKFRRLILTEVT